jgi:hypothetical protein
MRGGAGFGDHAVPIDGPSDSSVNKRGGDILGPNGGEPVASFASLAFCIPLSSERFALASLAFSIPLLSEPFRLPMSSTYGYRE